MTSILKFTIKGVKPCEAASLPEVHAAQVALEHVKDVLRDNGFAFEITTEFVKRRKAKPEVTQDETLPLDDSSSTEERI